MQTKAIKGKIKSVGSIKKITKTMEMVSASKMKKALDEAYTIRPFFEESKIILEDIVSNRRIKHPLVEKNEGNKILYIIVSSHKGLCGGYNANIYRKYMELKSGKGFSDVDVIAIGKYSEKIAKKGKSKIVLSYQATTFSAKESRSLAKFLVNEYRDKKYASISIIYTHLLSSSTFAPTETALLPYIAKGHETRAIDSLFQYEPSEHEVLGAGIPMMIQNIITSSVLESYASEHSSRMLAMKSATDNASELQDDLKLYYNRARQGAVTQEIAEITSGAMALS